MAFFRQITLMVFHTIPTPKDYSQWFISICYFKLYKNWNEEIYPTIDRSSSEKNHKNTVNLKFLPNGKSLLSYQNLALNHTVFLSRKNNKRITSLAYSSNSTKIIPAHIVELINKETNFLFRPQISQITVNVVLTNAIFIVANSKF